MDTTSDRLSRADASGSLPNWRYLLGRMHLTVATGDFATALAFVDRVGALAEEQGHHPEIDLRWGRVHVATGSHDVGGVSERDVRLGLAIDTVVTELGLTSQPHRLGEVEIAVDAMDIGAVRPFWAAVLGWPTADLHVYTLGRFRVYHHDRALDGWTGQKSRSLFKHLLIHRDAPVHTEQLLDYFWGDSSPDMARRSLYQTIYLVRQALQALGRPVIIQVNGGYQFNPELNVWVDCETFMGQYHVGLEAAGRGDDDGLMVALLAAEALYEGEFMAEDPYEEWPVARREQLRNAYLDALDRLSRHFWATREDGPCIVYCRKLLEIDACREDIHRRLMRVFARRGERSLALRQYLRCVEALREELDVEPLADTTRLYRQVLENELHF